MFRTLSLVSLLVAVSANGLAQDKLDGKWATDKSQNPEGPVQLEITVVAARSAYDLGVKGTLSLGGLGGNFYTFDQVNVSRAARIYFRVRVAQSTYSTWYAQLVDDNTITLWSHGLDLVGDNVLDLLQQLAAKQPQQAAPAALPPATPPAALAVQSAQVIPATPAATPTDPPPSCVVDKPRRCYVLHRVN